MKTVRNTYRDGLRDGHPCDGRYYGSPARPGGRTFVGQQIQQNKKRREKSLTTTITNKPFRFRPCRVKRSLSASVRRAVSPTHENIMSSTSVTGSRNSYQKKKKLYVIYEVTL